MDKIKKFNDFSNLVKNVLYLLGLLGVICGSIYLTIDKTFESKVNEMARGLNQRVANIETYVNDQIVTYILKQVDKIKSGDEEDIKQADIENIMKYWHIVNEPADNIRIAYDQLVEYYKEHF